MTVRVIRILEYVYPDHAAAEQDMAHWKFPAIGMKAFGQGTDKDGNRIQGVVITSTVMPSRTLRLDESVNYPPDKEITDKQCNDWYYKQEHDAHVWETHEGPRGDVFYRCTGFDIQALDEKPCYEEQTHSHEPHVWSIQDSGSSRVVHYRCLGYMLANCEGVHECIEHLAHVWAAPFGANIYLCQGYSEGVKSDD